MKVNIGVFAHNSHDWDRIIAGDLNSPPGEPDWKFVQAGMALGDLADRVEISPLQECESTRSPIDNPLWDALAARTQVAYPGADLVPGLITGGTDARFYRAKGAIAYGAALFSPLVTMESFGTRFHGNDERISVGSVDLALRALRQIVADRIG